MSKKLTTEEFIEKAKKIHGEKYNYSFVKYKNNTEKLIIICPIHGKTLQSSVHHLNGWGCPKCGREQASKNRVKSQDQFIKESKHIYGIKYNYSKVKYINSKTKIIITCKKHGDFLQLPPDHLSGKGCYKCGRIKSAIKRTLTTESFIERANKIYNNKYDYSKTKYKHTLLKVIILCPIHGKFHQTPNTHLSGIGCNKCSKEESRFNKTKILKKSFIERANKIHNNKYDYSLVEYKHSREKVKIICPKHGIFEQTPDNHLQEYGCSKCGIETTIKSTASNVKEFIEESNKIYKNKYDYSLVEYKNCDIKVIIKCPIHGKFHQTPYIHLRGGGCQKCSHTISSSETFWLNMINIPDNKEHRQVSIRLNKNKLIRADGYDPITKTVYEFYGDYWHGNPKVFSPNKLNKDCHKTFEELYKRTKKTERIIRKFGYKLVTMWEYDFKKLLKKNKLKNKSSPTSS